MRISRRQVMVGLAAISTAGVASGRTSAQAVSAIQKLPPPIGAEERAARIERLQLLMQKAGVGAVVIEPGSSLTYFTGVQWWRSERFTGVLIPRDGRPCIITPFFEEPSVRETLGIAAEVRTWQEHESPMRLAANWLRERKLTTRPVAIEETVRHFIVDGLRDGLPRVNLISGADLVRGCRMHKSAPELALMQAAADITLAAFGEMARSVRAGMTPTDLSALYDAAVRARGGDSDGGLFLIGEASAYPHGSGKPQRVGEGDVILMDAGCRVHGYSSDISRTFVFGPPSVRQREIWDHVRRGQDIAMEAAQLGRTAGSVDDAVRAYYEKLGFGPGYKLPGLPHRTGHGIGMDGHEPVNLVHGEATPLASGMCFSNEPGLYIPGEFGIRLEDCFHMTDAGPKWFTVPPASIDSLILG